MNKRTDQPRWTPRRLLSLLMALIMTLSLLPTAVLADGDSGTSTTSGYTIEVDAPDTMIAEQTYTGASATLKGDASASGYNKVRFNVTVTKDGTTVSNFESVKIMANDGTRDWNLAEVGWGPSDGFPVEANYSATTNFSELYFAEPGVYTATFELINWDNKTVLASGSKTITVYGITDVTVDRDSLTAGDSFTVTAKTNAASGYVYFTYADASESVAISPLPDGTGYAKHTFTAVAGNNEVKATLFGVPGTTETHEKTAFVNVTAAPTKPSTYTIRFERTADEVNATNWPADMTVTAGDDGTATFTLPYQYPARDGYVFSGWTDGVTTYSTGGTWGGTTNSNLTLHAMWDADTVTVTFNNLAPNSGVSYAPGTPSTTTVTKGTSISFRLSVAEGYDPSTMVVKAVVKAGDTVLVPIKDENGAYQYTFTANADTTVSVIAPSKLTYTVTLPGGDRFQANFTTPTTSDVTVQGKQATVNYDGSVSFTITPAKNWTINDVYANGSCTLDKLTDGSYTVSDVKSNVSISVDMSETVFHTVYYILDGAEMTTQQVADNTALGDNILKAPAKTGYTWNNKWYTDEDYKVEYNPATTTVTEDLHLYGKYDPNQATITYDVLPGVSTTKTYGLAATLTEQIPTKTGFKFLGWSETENATVASYLPGATFSKEIDEQDLTLYAVWEGNTYTVTLPSGTGYSIVTDQSTTVAHGESFSFTVKVDRAYAAKVPTVTVNNAPLDPSDSNGTQNNDGSVSYTYTISGITENKVVSVQVTQNSVYTVTFVTNGATYQTQQVGYGEKPTQPQDPKVEGYTFGGWYTDTTYATQWNFATDTVTDNTTIYAKLTPIKPVITWPTEQTGYTLTITNPTSLTNSGTVDYNTVVEFTITIKDGYDATGMQVGVNGAYLAPLTHEDNTYTFKFPATQDSTITVVGITRKTVTITYNDNGGFGGPVQQTVNYYVEGLTDNGTINSTVPNRVGYEFKGWSTDNNATWDGSKITHATGVTATDVLPGADSKFTQDTVLYAVWASKETAVTLTVDKAEQYEGEDVTLTATVKSDDTAVTSGSVQFYRSTDSGTTWTLLDSKTVSGGTAVLTAATSDYVRNGANKDTYKAVFVPTEGAGYTGVESTEKPTVTVKSAAISWKLSSSDAIEANANKLTIKQGDTIVTAMTAGQVYTLELPAIYALDEQNTKLTVNKDYSVTWQFCNAQGVWDDYTNAASGDTATVDAAYSQYKFRAVVEPITGATSHFTKAAKFDANGLVPNQYEVSLISEPTDTVKLQSTTTALRITGAESEAANVKINGSADMFTTIDNHLAQFEGQTVTLTATVTAENAAVSTGKVYFYRYVDGANDVKLNETAVTVTNGVAQLTGVQISEYVSENNKTAADNYDQFYAVYEANETYDTSSSKTELKTVYIMSTAIKTPVIDVDGNKATTYDNDVDDLLAGVEHSFTLRTGAEKAAWSVVALDGRTVSSSDYTIQWITKTGDNETVSTVTGSEFKTTDNKVGDAIYVRLNPTGNMKTGADSRKAIIGTKQGVTVTVTADKDWVYQLNPITLTATVAAAATNATMDPTGTVTFYYSVDNGSTWTQVGETQNLTTTGNTVSASISPSDLPVKAGDNTKQDVTITAVYSGDATFKTSGNYNETTKAVSAGTTANGVTDKTVTVYSSVVYVDKNENTTNTLGEHGIIISAEDGKVLANEANVNLTLSDVYTLDHATDAADKAALTYGTDYTVQWQVLSNAAAYSNAYASSETPWQTISGATGTTCQIDVEQGAAYRAVITVNNTPIAKGSYDAVQQNDHPGRRVYYSNILVAASAPASLSVNVNTSNTSKGYEGIVEGETVTIHTFTSGATGTTPISKLTVEIYAGKEIVTGATPVFTAENSNVNGHVSFDWEKNVTPGYYTLKVNASFTNGYSDQTIEKQLIVRDNDYSFTVSGDEAVYNGRVQGLNVVVDGMNIEEALAQKSVVVYYYTDAARTQQVEPTQAGTYYATIRLQESAYWTEKTQDDVTFTVLPREVSVVDLVAQAKVYDGTTNANIQEIILNDSAVDANGVATGDKGIIDGDSVYATGTGYTNTANAGLATLGVKDVTLAGDDAANYTLKGSTYTEDFNIQRSQVKGALISGATYQYTGKDIKLSANDIYLIDQAGNVLTNYTVTYYYHNGDGVEKVDAMNKLGKYTVIARPEQTNYKGGASTTVYVGQSAVAGTLDTSAKSALISITDTVKLYDGQSTGVTVSATKGTASANYYYDGAWKDTAPTAAGRYLVKVTTDTGDTAYGIYTIVKARPELTLSATGATYNSAQISGTPSGTFNGADFPAGTYYTYTGGTIQGVAYEAPTEAGKYIVTAHVPETGNYTAFEISAAFEITRAPLTITADSFSRQQYGAYPDLTASFSGLATGGVAADTSLRDVQIQPELIDDSGYTNDASDQVGNKYSITAVAALARNYDVSYVKGNMSVTREDPKPYLEIRGMIENGDGETDLAYYGDVIQLYAYGNQSEEGVVNTSSTLEWSSSDPSIAKIDSKTGLMKIEGVGTVTITLKRGYGAQQISTTLTFTAEKQEVKVVIPNEDKVYNGSDQTYTTASGYGVNSKLEPIGSDYKYENTTRKNVGSQIVTGKVLNSDKFFKSETYGGLFTINVKDVTVTPNEANTTYGSPVSSLGYKEDGIVNSVAALTGGKAVSIADAYSNLDVYDGYEILVAGQENENYNVKYITDQDAPDVKVKPLSLTVSTGTLNEQVGMTSGSLNPAGKYPVNGAEVVPNTAMGAANTRMYGEPNWVMDDTLTTLISGDSLADLLDLNDKLVNFNYGIGADANVSYSNKSTKLQKNGSAMSDYSIETGSSMIAFSNYDENYDLGTQNIYQRPVTLALRKGLSQLNAYKPAIMPNGSVDKTALEELILNNLVVGKYNDEGGLAELLKHTIKDLDLQITYSVSGDTITVTVTVGNQNYYLASSPFTVTVKLDSTKIVADYGTLGWTSSTVTMYNVNEAGIKTTPTYVTGDVTYLIFAKDNTVTETKYSNYKDKTPVLNKKMTKGASTGLYIVNYDRLPAGEYVMFAIAEGYTIIE